MKGKKTSQAVEEVTTVVVRFAGDSGDGIQITGNQFGQGSAVSGNDVHTLPDFPAEIRAPAGTLHGVSGFQLSLSSEQINTAGDKLDLLVAMNPAALKTNLSDLKLHGLLLLDEDKFTEKDWQKAGYDEDPTIEIEKSYRVVKAPITSLAIKSVEELELSRAKARKCKNMFALGIVYWLYSKELTYTINWLEKKFADKELVAKSNIIALIAGYNYAITAELFSHNYQVKKASLPAGEYRQITGNEAISLAVATAAKLSSEELLVAGYPITPASDILHYCSNYQALNVKTFQAEDEMAAIGAAIGAAYAGHLSLSCSSGPGIDLKAESLGLAAMVELPTVLIDVQRAGPSTGMPTKVEQADLLQVMYGRHGECPIPVIAASTPGDCYYAVLEAFKIAVNYMTPVILLSDAYLANGAELWNVPNVDSFEKINLPDIKETGLTNVNTRNENLVRKWIKPGTKGLQHRIGGLEKDYDTGQISYTPENHQLMVDTRLEKIENIAKAFPKVQVCGNTKADLLIVSWGSNWGALDTAVSELNKEGYSVAYVHLRYLFPLQQDLGNVIKNYPKVACLEMNKGQLLQILRAKYLVDIKPINKVTGKPFKVTEIKDSAIALLGEDYASEVRS